MTTRVGKLDTQIAPRLRALHLDANQGGTRGPPRAPSSLAGTMMALDLPSFVKQAAGQLPFGGKPSPDFIAGLAAPKPALAATAEETMGIGVDLMALVQSTLPFAKQDAEGAKPAAAKRVSFPRLPLQTYASLCAELSVFPDRAADILKKYGINDEDVPSALRRVSRGEVRRPSARHPA